MQPFRVVGHLNFDSSLLLCRFFQLIYICINLLEPVVRYGLIISNFLDAFVNLAELPKLLLVNFRNSRIDLALLLFAYKNML